MDPIYTSEPKLLPSPSLQGYLAEYGRFPQKAHIYAAEHLWQTVLIFLLWYTAISYFTIPRLYRRYFASSIAESIVDSTSKVDPNVTPTQENGVVIKPTLAEIPTPTPVPEDRVPLEINIPKINVHASVEQVGQTKTYEMDVPKNAANAAWYVYGAKPGEDGNAVIDGHYDTPSGKPAVFFNLKKLMPKDEVEILAQDGSKKIFIVEKVDIVAYNAFPAEYVFHTKPGKNLNLITCGGIWNAIQKNYNQRIVVYTSLKEG